MYKYYFTNQYLKVLLKIKHIKRADLHLPNNRFCVLSMWLKLNFAHKNSQMPYL